MLSALPNEHTSLYLARDMCIPPPNVLHVLGGLDWAVSSKKP
jgi:hypothetical protein